MQIAQLYFCKHRAQMQIAQPKFSRLNAQTQIAQPQSVLIKRNCNIGFRNSLLNHDALSVETSSKNISNSN